MKIPKIFNIVIKAVAILLILCIIFPPFAIVNAGERGILMQFGQVEKKILDEGLHLIIPIINTVQTLSVRIQKQEVFTEAYSKDLQVLFTDVVVNWHLMPAEVNLIYQQIGTEKNVIDRIINPSAEEVLKAVIAKYTAEEIITKREEVKARIDKILATRLANYYLDVDGVSLVNVQFSQRFSDAVEAKQIAEQEFKRAKFIVLKASKEAEAQVNLAKGEAEAQRLLRETLTPALLAKKAIEKWDGRLPLIVGKNYLNYNEIR